MESTQKYIISPTKNVLFSLMKNGNLFCILELFLLLNYQNSALVLIGMKQNAIHVWEQLSLVEKSQLE